MPTPSSPELQASALLAALLATGMPMRAGQLAQKTELSRPTVHRRLLSLQKHGFIRAQGSTPHRYYTCWTVQDVLREQVSAVPDALLLVLPRTLASVLTSALEMLARLHIGQWGMFTEEFRLWASMDQLSSHVEPAERLIDEAKQLAWRMSSSASLGIHHPDISAEGSQAWSVMRVLRHRLAWDRTPQGGMGVHFDEPLGVPPEHVSTLCWTHGDQVCLVAPASLLPVLATAVEVYRQVRDGRATLLQEFLRPGHALAPEAATRVQALLEQAQGLLQDVKGTKPLNEGDLPYLLSTPIRIADAADVLREHLQAAQAPMPPGYLLGFSGGQVKVLEVNGGDDSVIVGSSLSAQTALAKAHNLANAGRARSSEF